MGNGRLDFNFHRHRHFQKKEKLMNEHVVITLSCGTDNPNRATRAVQLATIAQKEGKQTTLFLLDEGVYIAKKGLADNIKAATGDMADDHIAYLQAHDVPILVCTPCATARGIEEKDLIEGARMATAVELIRLSCEAAVINL
jgi:predicted peroxiredoxin